MQLGRLNVLSFLNKVDGDVTGRLITDAKARFYRADYEWLEDDKNSDWIYVWRKDGNGDTVHLKKEIELTEELVSFFGLYSGDGAKGSEVANTPGKVKPVVSFSQKEPNLVKFAVQQFKKVFSNSIRFTFSLGEDSAYFFAGKGADQLLSAYGGKMDKLFDLATVRPKLNDADNRYLGEIRRVPGTNEENLAFYYQHKDKMQEILTEYKANQLKGVGIVLGPDDKVTASLRRPYKKGARKPGGTSRSDETHVGGVNGMGELFLKMIHEVEDSIANDHKISTQGLVEWNSVPSDLGELIDTQEFFTNNPFGQINNERPSMATISPGIIEGKFPRSKPMEVKDQIRINPLFCYTSGLYLAEGSTDKAQLFTMFRERPTSFSLGFTSSEDLSVELMLRTLEMMFDEKDCMGFWKIKVGSQYFPELVVVGLKEAVPMLRGGASGDGKMRTMEISLAIKSWGVSLAPSLERFANKFSHVEPTGAGVPRVDFSASSTLCRWYFPLLMYATFKNTISNPLTEFA